MENIETLQKEYDIIVENVKKYTAEKKAFLDKIQVDGLTIVSKKIKEDEKVFGAFHDLNYYSHFDGHTSDPIYNYYSGASELSDKEFHALKKIIKDFQDSGSDDDTEAHATLQELDLDLYVDYCFWDAYDFFKHFKIINEEHIKWEYSGSSDQGELCDGSEVDFLITTKSVIKKTRNVETEERG